jgi:1,4-alpha-glucan branching enzyme
LARIQAEEIEVRPIRRLRPSIAIAAGIAILATGVVIGRYSRPAAGVAPAVASGSTSASVRFVHVAPGATAVSLVGDFNQWNPSAIPLRRLGDGTWIVDVPLSPGRYAYAFIVDGRIVIDPAAPRANGEFGANSVLMVGGS